MLTNRIRERYTNKNTIYSDYTKTIDPTKPTIDPNILKSMKTDYIDDVINPLTSPQFSDSDYSKYVNNLADREPTVKSQNMNGTIDTNSRTLYDTNNYNVQYHDTEAALNQLYNVDISANQYVYVRDNSGNIVQLSWSKDKGNPTYYEPGSLRFSPSNYVPRYEDTVFYSKLTGLSYPAPVYKSQANNGGFCSYYTDKTQIEEKCNSLDNDTCASTNCCVLLGGSKCVAGDDKGPLFKSNYSDVYIQNKNTYYYQGKCYGFCKYDNDFTAKNTQPPYSYVPTTSTTTPYTPTPTASYYVYSSSRMK